MANLIKKIIALTLICVLTIPANAAVSVSDGSAFVSKAEFATDLNNISSRVSQLENSIDAKIDSLVSSYLSRNGIWNGEKQSVTQNEVFYGLRTNGTTNTNTYAYLYRPSADNKTGNSQKIESETSYNLVRYGNNSTTIMSNITKSGLCFISARVNVYKTNGKYLRWSNFVDGSITVAGYFNVKSTVDNVSISPFSFDKFHDGGGYYQDPFYTGGNYNYNVTISLFVNKGDSLILYGYDVSNSNSLVGVNDQMTSSTKFFFAGCGLTPLTSTVY